MEKEIHVKGKRMICSVKGCGNRETFFISKGGDFSGTPNICSDCIKKTYRLLFPYLPDETAENDGVPEDDDTDGVQVQPIEQSATPEKEENKAVRRTSRKSGNK